jgi:hypothetical protein
VVTSFRRFEERRRVCLEAGDIVFVVMERVFTYYYRAGKLTLRDLERMKARMDALFTEFPTADIA